MHTYSGNKSIVVGVVAEGRSAMEDGSHSFSGMNGRKYHHRHDDEGRSQMSVNNNCLVPTN